MKLWRYTFIAAMAVWLLMGLGTGHRVFFILFSLQLLLLAAALAINIWAALTFAYTQELGEEQTVRGRAVDFRLRIHNEKPFPFPMMKINLSTADPLNLQTLDFNLGANSKLAFDLTLDCPHRGDYLIGMNVIDFVDLFGLIRLPFDMRLLPYYREKRLTVYPRLIELNSPTLLTAGSKTLDGKRYSTDNPQDPFSTVRSYRPGDPRKLIHWKISLRQQKLMTRQFDHLSEPRILILFDSSRPAGSARDVLSTIDSCCETAAAVTKAILGRGWPVRIVSGQDAGKALMGDSLKDFSRIHSWLAKVEFKSSQPFYELFQSELNHLSDARSIIAITHHADSELLPCLVAARHHQIPIQFFMTGLAAVDQSFVAKVRQCGLPAWFYQSADELADQMGKSR